MLPQAPRYLQAGTICNSSLANADDGLAPVMRKKGANRIKLHGYLFRLDVKPLLREGSRNAFRHAPRGVFCPSTKWFETGNYGHFSSF